MTTEQFHWTAPSGEEIVLPHMRNIPGRLLRKNRGGNDLDVLFALLEEADDPEMLGRVDDLTLGDLENLVSAWGKQLTSGESGRSSSS